MSDAVVKICFKLRKGDFYAEVSYRGRTYTNHFNLISLKKRLKKLDESSLEYKISSVMVKAAERKPAKKKEARDEGNIS